MFESQHEWFDHELRHHRKQFQCQVCNDSAPSTGSQLESHIRDVHPNETALNTTDAFLDGCRIQRMDATECPLCTEWGEKLQQVNKSSKCDVSLKQFQVHLGRHMEQLALSALPEDDVDGDDGDGDDEVGDEEDRDGKDRDGNTIVDPDTNEEVSIISFSAMNGISYEDDVDEDDGDGDDNFGDEGDRNEAPRLRSSYAPAVYPGLCQHPSCSNRLKKYQNAKDWWDHEKRHPLPTLTLHAP
jgi:hypothetical protein